MTLLSAWALAGLVLLVPLVIAHLRREQRPLYDVPTLLIWEQLEQRPSAQSRSLRVPRLPLLLALQALALIVLVVALARPSASAASATGSRIYVLDDSVWMSTSGRLEAAEHQLTGLAAKLPRHTTVHIVLADGAPHVIYNGAASGVADALAKAPAGAAPDTLPVAMTVAAGLIAAPHEHVVLVRAPEDPAPSVRVSPGEISTFVAGTPVQVQGIYSPSARCGIGAADRCEVIAVVGNTAPFAVDDHFVADANGSAALAGLIHVAPHSTSDIVLAARPGEHVTIGLDTGYVLPAATRAYVTVPGPANTPPSSTVTLVGQPSDATTVARALAAVPGVTLQLRTPSQYTAAIARSSDLVVLDGWLPKLGLPPSPSVLLVNPPRVPGGHVGATTPDSQLSGTDATDPLLAGVELTSLELNSGALHVLTLPDYLRPIAWSAGGPLLAAGDDGRQQVAVLPFDPSASDLPQLSSFPVLAANLVQWAAGWAPATAPVGEPIRLDATPGAREFRLTLGGATVERGRLQGRAVAVQIPRAGVYELAETGPGVDRTATIAASVMTPTTPPLGGPIDLIATSAVPSGGHGPDRGPWLLIAAIVALALEWTYWRVRAPRLRSA